MMTAWIEHDDLLHMKDYAMERLLAMMVQF